MFGVFQTGITSRKIQLFKLADEIRKNEMVNEITCEITVLKRFIEENLQNFLNRDNSFNMRVWIIILQGEIFKLKIKDIFYTGVNFHNREWFWFPA